MDVRSKQTMNINEQIKLLEDDVYYCRVEIPINAVNLMEFIDINTANGTITPGDAIDLKSNLKNTLSGFRGNCSCKSLFH